ncbi:hypothetical protein BUM88_05945 [Acinetobacter calcoaceticus]|uniref:hypothetical protein n=1 Tax=Acinetobacter TaxID=469 RepID=UPI0006F3EAC2|nr:MULTISPECIES: hypothetical protein [Acinetobacter]AQZ81181.1 hypothetical protein BUM88_05945 [Acinetobacter calcoaceticus]KQQ76266.1 hypothetical protein ASF86_01845 [Acinetobacter sp. Leaf130]
MEMILGVFGLLILWIILTKRHKKQTVITERPIDYFFDIVGEQSYQANLRKIAGPKQERSKYVEVMARVVSEPFNAYDKNAVKIEINGLTVGYLSRDDAKVLAGKVINQTVPALINGGWLDDNSEGSYGVKLGIQSLNELI